MRSLSIVGILSVSLLLCGCGGGTEPDTYTGARGTVTGKVTYKGVSVAKGTGVIFVSDLRQAIGIVDETGQYSLKAVGNPQIPAGMYKVELTPAPTGAPVESTNVDPNTPPAVRGPIGFPEIYLSKDTSMLTFEVKAGANTHDISITD